VLILVCTVSFPILSRHPLHLFLYFPNEVSLLVFTATFCFQHWKVLFQKTLLALLKLLFCFYLAIEVGNWLLRITNSGHYLIQCFCTLLMSCITFDGFRFLIKYSIIDLCPPASQLNLWISLCLKNVFNILKLLYVQKSNHF
jgi:hypothetical protein